MAVAEIKYSYLQIIKYMTAFILLHNKCTPYIKFSGIVA